jgi:hypothetical protein
MTAHNSRNVNNDRTANTCSEATACKEANCNRWTVNIRDDTSSREIGKS